jgi:putative endonuclease
MVYTLYILRNLKVDKFYVGHTNDINRRFVKHNSGQTKSTKPYIPWVLVFSKYFKNKSDAAKAELFIKKKKSKKFILRLIMGNVDINF